MKFSKQTKIVIIAIGGLLILILVISAILELAVPSYKESKETCYSYNSQGSIDYKVYLKPNIMYDSEYLEKDRIYVLKYIDRIEMEFKYAFSGSSSANVSTEYNVTAYLQGLHGPDSEVLWSKDFPLVPQKNERGEYQNIKITEHASVDPAMYQDLKESIHAESEVNAPVVLNVVFKIHSRVETENGKLDDSLSPSLAIPIGERVFRIDGQAVLTGANKIEKIIKEPIPVNKSKVVFLSVFSLILIAGLILVYRMEEAEEVDPYDKAIAAIFKEYGERMAGMEHAISYLLTDVIHVNCIEDMVKIADEVGQPVFYYKADKKSERKIEFYVFDNNRIYYMVMFGEVKQEDLAEERLD